MVAREKGIADTTQSVMDESGDTYYGAFCYVYTVAYKENTTAALKQMKHNWRESQKPQQGTETTNSKDSQTRVDPTRWETTPVVLSEELLTIAVGPVEKIKMMASNAMDHEAIMASVRACSEETAAILDMTSSGRHTHVNGSKHVCSGE